MVAELASGISGAVLAVAIAACSPNANESGDAGTDAPADASDRCGATSIHVTGELVDWDSTAASFKGIAAATLTARADPTKTTKTSSSGRFELCIANDAQTLVDVQPPSPYIGGMLVVLKDVTGSNGNFELRSYTKARGQTGPSPFDTTKAQLFVQIIGGSRAVDVSSKHDAGFHFTGAAWEAGAAGTNVHLPNVDPDGGSTKLVIANSTPLSTIPLVAGTFTYVVVVAL